MDWVLDPQGAHRQWREGLVLANGRAYAEHSSKVYTALFGKFARWMAQERLDLASIRAEHIALFLETALVGRTGEASVRTQRSYLAEISRVMAAVVADGVRADNPVSGLLAQIRRTTPLKPRSIMFVPPRVWDAYMDRLGRDDPAQCEPHEVMLRAIAALVMEMGLTIKEVQRLSLRDVAGGELARQVRAPGHRGLQPRTAVLSEPSSRWVSHWMQLRQRYRVLPQRVYRQLMADSKAGDHSVVAMAAHTYVWEEHLAKVFVTPAGKSNHLHGGLRSAAIALNRIREQTVYEAAKSVCDCLEVASQRAITPQALRNLCGVHWLNAGLSDRDVASRLGLITLDQVWALRRTGMCVLAQG